MKRTLILLFVLASFLSLAQTEENNHLDSLMDLTSKYSRTQLVDVFIEIAKLQGLNDAVQAHKSADEAIRLATQIKYPEGIGKAYLAKGSICNISNNPLKGVEHYKKAEKIFSQLDDRANMALAVLGTGESYSQQGIFDKAIEAYDNAILFFDYVGDYKSLANAYYKSGTTYNMVDDYYDALNSFVKAAEYYEKANDDYGFHLSENSIAIVMYYLGNYKGAVEFWTKYEDAMRELEDWYNVSITLSNKGLIYIRWAEYDEALAIFTEALELAEISGNNSNIANIYNSMGNAFHDTKNFEKSFEYYRKTVVLGEKTDSKQTVSIGMHNIGELHLNLGNADSALYYIQKSLQIENTLFNKRGIAETKATMGKVYIALKKYRLAFSFFEQAEDVFDALDDVSGLADIYQKYGQAYADIGNDSLTIYYLKKSIAIAEEIDMMKMQYENHQYLADFYEKTNDYKNALLHQKLFHQINDSIFNQKTFDKTAYLTIKLEKEAQSKELVELQHAQDVANYQNKIKDYVVYFVALIFIILAISFYIRYTSSKRSTERLNEQYQIVLESEEKIKALFDASHDVVLLVDRKGEILSANSKAETTLHNGDQLVGYNFKEIIQPLFQNQFDQYISWTLNNKKGRKFNLISTIKRNYEITISPIFKHGIDVSGLAIYLQDVTDILTSRDEKKKLEEQLFQVQKLESVGTMAGGVAHDFNNYLGTILGYSSMGFDDSAKDTSARRYFDQIMAAAKSAQHTVQKILTFSRKNESEKLSRINLVDVAKDAIAMVESTKPAEVDFLSNNGVESIEILGDSIEIQQVFINLFNNAFHAMEGIKKGHLECSISNSLFDEEHQSIVKEFKSNNIAGIRVSDNGIGMAPQVVKRIFEPFFTTKDVGSGTGLGLSVVHGIIKNHQGELHVESKLGKGSTFYVYLPAIS